MKKTFNLLAIFVLLAQTILPNFLYAQATETPSGDLETQRAVAQAEVDAAQDALDKAESTYQAAQTALSALTGSLP
jgi:hypothetical protein